MSLSQRDSVSASVPMPGEPSRARRGNWFLISAADLIDFTLTESPSNTAPGKGDVMALRTKPFTSIRGKLMAAFLFFVIIPTLVIFWSYARSSKEAVANGVYSANQELVDRSAKSANDVASRMIKALSLLELDLQEYYGDGVSNWTTDYGDYYKVATLQKRMSTIRDLLLDSGSFLIFSDFKELAVSTLNSFDMRQNFAVFLQEPWYLQGKENKGFPQWFLPFLLKHSIGYTGAAQEGGYLALSRSIHDEKVTYDFGVALIGVPVETAFAQSTVREEGLLPSLLLWDGGRTATDSQGNRVIDLSETEMAELQRAPGEIKHLRDAEGRLYMVNVSEVPELGMSILRPVPEKQFLADLEKRMSRSVFSILAVFVLGILIFVLFLIRFTSPIASLLRSMKQVGDGDFRTSVQVKGNDEIALLGNNFNRMVTRLAELVQRLDEEQKLKEEANFQSLQAQINPHFLFNTLNSIKLMAMLSNTNRNVSNMITALGKLLEFSMKFNQRFVTLGQELDYLELYMSLQKMRFQDQIEIELRVPEELKDVYVLKFSLQPLVENSIVHGGKLPLHIVIGAEAGSGGTLQVSIRDDGNGVTEEQLAEIMDRLEQSHAKYSGIGISNVDRRIKLYFGESYGVTLHRVDSGGLEATIKFPLRKEAPP
ncbi:MAG: hypothetical protein K0Q90_1219 [Paenibacillaceae bacterium]|nr:hypothetical protein [Paenibacillaceae bacterium]